MLAQLHEVSKHITSILLSCCLVLCCLPAAAQESAPDIIYQQHCARCHGNDGDGAGPAHTMQRPWPRNFQAGQYKFRSTPIETLPTTQDVTEVIYNGILRTSMPPFKDILTQQEIQAVATYVLEISKQFSDLPDGTESAFAKPINLDTVSPSEEQHLQGQQLFAQNCADCHGTSGRGNGPLATEMRDSDGFWIAPADLTDPMAYGGGHKPSDIYLRLVTGIPGSSMPIYDDILDKKALEAIALYTASLQIKPEKRPFTPYTQHTQTLEPHVRGEYLVRAMSCGLCHTPYDEEGHYYPELYLAGGVAITLPGLGVFPTRNLTSHADGLANWTEEEIVRVLTTGHAKDRKIEAFAMPWVFFSELEQQDARDIAAYLKSMPPVQNKIPERSYEPIWQRLFKRIKQLLGFEYGRLEYPPLNVGDRRAHETS